MQERYRLLHLTAPAVEELEASIRKLREVIAAHKETIAEKEAEIGCNNPAVFKTLQVGQEKHRRNMRSCASFKLAISCHCCPAGPATPGQLSCEAIELLQEGICTGWSAKSYNGHDWLQTRAGFQGLAVACRAARLRRPIP